MQDNKTLPHAFATDTPATALDASNFAQPLIVTPQGAQWTAQLNPETGAPAALTNTNFDFTAEIAPITISATYGLDRDNAGGQTWTRVHKVTVNGNGVTEVPSNLNALAAAAAQLLANDRDTGNFNIASLADLLTDGQEFDFGAGVPPIGASISQAAGIGFTGVTGTYDRYRVASATNVGATSSKGAQLATAPGEWTLNSEPAANTTATATRAAGGAGVRHVLTSVNASLIGVAAIAAPISVVVRDGATGVGAILWRDKLFTPAAGSRDRLTISGLNIVGSVNTAITVEFTGGPGATNFEVLSATGYDVPD
jgi:hypothetical protein